MGILYIIATPIGNLEDITYRAVKILKQVDVIACEDTRHSLKLLNHLGIKKKLVSSHSYNADKSIQSIGRLLEGQDVAYITDSGTPCISDPGSRLVDAMLTQGYSVIPIPGPSAITAFLSVIGWDVPRFTFVGFLSPKQGKRKKQLQKLLDYDTILVLYESPFRIKKFLLDVYAVFGSKPVALGRELTKKFEDIQRSELGDIIQNLETIKEKGEYIIAVDNTSR